LQKLTENNFQRSQAKSDAPHIAVVQEDIDVLVLLMIMTLSQDDREF
jgi:hypothetical protein